MAAVLKHRKVNIVSLDQGEPLSGNCRPGDIAICAESDGWWLRFVGAGDVIDSYDLPYPEYKQALWAAKAAAEFGV